MDIQRAEWWAATTNTNTSAVLWISVYVCVCACVRVCACVCVVCHVCHVCMWIRQWEGQRWCVLMGLGSTLPFLCALLLHSLSLLPWPFFFNPFRRKMVFLFCVCVHLRPHFSLVITLPPSPYLLLPSLFFSWLIFIALINLIIPIFTYSPLSLVLCQPSLISNPSFFLENNNNIESCCRRALSVGEAPVDVLYSVLSLTLFTLMFTALTLPVVRALHSECVGTQAFHELYEWKSLCFHLHLNTETCWS